MPQAVVDQARGALGVPYVWGGEDYETGMDCSGLVTVCYDRAIGAYVPHQTLSIYECELFEHVGGIEELVPGDLIEDGGCEPCHVGIWTGDSVIHEPTFNDVCREVGLEEFRNWVSGEETYLHYIGGDAESPHEVACATEEEQGMEFMFIPNGSGHVYHYAGGCIEYVPHPDCMVALNMAYQSCFGRDMPCFEIGSADAPYGSRLEQACGNCSKTWMEGRF